MLLLLFSIFSIHLVALATPGPDFFLVSQVAASEARTNSLKTVAGITVGCIIWAGIALLGLHVVIQKMAWLHRGIMILGGLYLCYLAILLFKSALSHSTPQSDDSTSLPTVHRKGFFIKGVFTNLANPKALVYFASIFSMIVTDDMSGSTRWIILVLIALETFLWFFLVSLIFSLPIIKQKYQAFTKWIDGAAGVLFAVFGAVLVFRGAFS